VKLKKLKSKQRGVALFITLLVVTIATLLATEIWFNNTLDISRSFNNRALYQANHYAKGMALWATDVLRQDYENEASYDNHAEIWNNPIAGIELEDAVLSGQLTDLDGKFNLNNLVINGRLDDQSHAFFKRILINLELDESIADKIIDWMDADQIPREQGAEDVVYLSKSPSYRSAGQAFYHISELKLVDGIDARTYQRLKSYVTVLPVIAGNPTKININTAPTLILLSLDSRMKKKEALALYNDGSAANQSLTDFYRQPAIHIYRLGNQTLNLSRLLATTSQWYQAEINIKMENTVFQKFAILRRTSSHAVVKQWSQTRYD
jgi:general secretion pathway protein K